MQKCFSIILLLIAGYCAVKAQHKVQRIGSPEKLQYGFSVKSTLEISSAKHDHVYFRLGFNAGLGTNVVSNWFYPTYNLELQLYNGGLGSIAKSAANQGRYLSLNIVNSFTATFNLFGKQRFQTTGNDNAILSPLYYFGNFTYPALQNPFWNSLSFGSNFIRLYGKGSGRQRVGFFNIHINNFQASYANDGGFPFDVTSLGDAEDRFYTTVLFFNYQLRPSNLFNQLEVSYDKFTGYSQDAFQITHQLDLNYVHYADTVQSYYSKGVWALGLANVKKGCGITVQKWNDFYVDLQKIVHYDIYNPYHKSPYRPSASVSLSHFYTKYYNPSQ